MLKVLIVKLSSIGDIVHALPALSHIREQMPEAEIGWAVDSSYAEILRGNELIDHLVEIDTRSLRGGKVVEEMFLDVARQYRSLRKYKFDVALDMQGLLKSAAYRKFSGAGTSIGIRPQARFANREPRVSYSTPSTVDPPHPRGPQKPDSGGRCLGIEPIIGFEFPISIGD